MISFKAAVIPQPFLVDIAFQVYYNIIGIYIIIKIIVVHPKGS